MDINEYVHDYALTAYSFDGNAEDNTVAELIYKNVKGKKVLDLGCGPTEPVLSIFYPEAKEVVAVDRLQENISFTKKNNERLLGGIIERAMAYKQSHLSKRGVKPKVRYVLGGVTKRLKLGKSDSAMQIGCFGCLGTRKDFELAVKNAYRYLKDRGTLLMVNWEIGEDPNRPYYADRPLEVGKLYVPALREAGFEIKRLGSMSRLKKESKDAGFSKMIWAVARK